MGQIDDLFDGSNAHLLDESGPSACYPFSDGPWSLKNSESEPQMYKILSADGRVIGFPRRGTAGAEERRELEANAKLMAGAVDLFLELQNIVNATPEEWEDPSDFRAWAQSRARHTIAKVLG